MANITDRNFTRRAAVAAGLGALALAPVCALADVVARTGYKADGSAYEGLVTVEGKTYLYEAGVKYTGGQKEFRGSRYFHTDDGRMAVSEDVTWADGTKHHYDADGVLADSTELGEKTFTAGWYTLACKAGGVLDVHGAETADGARIQVYEANGSQAQRWRVMWDATVGAFRVETSAGVAEAGNAGITSPGSRVALWQDLWVGGKGLANQRWRISKDAEGYLTLANADNGFVLTAASGENEAAVTMERDTRADTQRWKATATGSYSGWWVDGQGHHHVNDPDTGMMVRGCKRVDPVYRNGEGRDDGWGSIYDFDAEGTAAWHLPTYDDLPGGAHGSGAAVPNVTQGDRRQRSILYALSRVGCPYRTGERPNAFVCDGLTGWAVNKGAQEDWGACDDASFQWALIKGLHGDPWGADMGKLKPGDLVFWGDDSGKPLTYYAGAFGDYGYGNYHAGMYYANGKMINARSAGVTDQTVVADYAGEMGWAYLGGGDPYRYDTSAFGVPHR